MKGDADRMMDERGESGQRNRFRRLRQLVHRRLIDSIESDGAALLTDPSVVRERVGWLVEDIQASNGMEISAQQQAQIQEEILEELGGLGPLAPLMMDPDISDILVNGPFEVWVDRFGRLEKTDVRFDDDEHLRHIVDRLVATQGRHLDTGSPMVDARLRDGSRLHAIIPALCAKGTIVSIRRFRLKPFDTQELLDSGFISEPMLKLLQLVVKARLNIVISGGAAAGKTTLLNLISRYIPQGERVVTIEETAELRLEHPHVIPLECRPANVEGRGGIDLRQLVRSALRMRADRIIVGEVRGSEVFDMLQAMNVGHDGSLTTVHANSPEDVLRRLETLVLMSDMGVPREAIREMIGASIHLIIHLMRFSDGSRRVVSIREVTNVEDSLSTRELFRYRANRGGSETGPAGQHVATGELNAYLQRIAERGYEPDPSLADSAANPVAEPSVPPAC